MHAPFVKHRYEMQEVICEAENDVVWPLRGRVRGNRDIEDDMILHYK